MKKPFCPYLFAFSTICCHEPVTHDILQVLGCPRFCPTSHDSSSEANDFAVPTYFLQRFLTTNCSHVFPPFAHDSEPPTPFLSQQQQTTYSPFNVFFSSEVLQLPRVTLLVATPSNHDALEPFCQTRALLGLPRVCCSCLLKASSNCNLWGSDTNTEEEFSKLQQELKAETLLVKILREKLCSKEDGLEQLQEEVASLVRSQEAFRSNIESLQYRLGNSNEKEKELELLLGGKENTVRCLQADLQECLKELTLLRGALPKVSEERDVFQQDVEQLTWQNMKLNAEVEALKKRVEKLDEDVLVREGQLSILQESLNI
ncbi:hypothetical protein KI387_038813 [Taxus chinensis]|uniref:Uncharacterized protein n=1 Tax=Taxus chinensis TaxID=29808 RepID=A0AA38FAN1_TAXCH|nr:hypothetical protein KI387_038813 [Taxus chinensis]